MENAEAIERATLRLVRSLLGVETDLSAKPLQYSDLADGFAMYSILHSIAPRLFRNMDEVAQHHDSTNWIIRKEGLMTLVRQMNEHAHHTLGVAEEFNLENIIDVDKLAGPSSPSLLEEGGDGGLHAKDTSAGGELNTITNFFIVMVTLSGVPEVLQRVRSLSRPEQVALSNLTKAMIQQHALKPIRRYETASSVTSESQRAASTRRSAATLSSRRTASPRFAATAASISGSPLIADDSYYRNAANHLRRELEISKARVAELTAQHELLQEDCRSWQNKYKLLLQEQAQRPPESTSRDTTALARKDSMIDTLTQKVTEQAAKLSAFKEATSAHETVLMAMKRKLRQAEEGLMVRSNELREAQERLAVADDRMVVQAKAREALESEVEELTSQVRVLQLTQRADPADNDPSVLTASFASNGSVDRVLQLENEKDELRNQRDALQKQLNIVQRQVTTMPPPTADAAAVSDTLKAQLRQTEKEKDELRQQLAAALDRVEELQNTVLHARASTTEQRDDSLCPGDHGDTPSPASLDGQARDAEPREHALLTSMLLQYGYHNLMLQQQRTLLYRDHHDAARLQKEWLEEAAAVPESKPSPETFLSRQRRDVARGLLNSIIHRKSQTLYADDADN